MSLLWNFHTNTQNTKEQTKQLKKQNNTKTRDPRPEIQVAGGVNEVKGVQGDFSKGLKRLKGVRTHGSTRFFFFSFFFEQFGSNFCGFPAV